MKLLAFLTIAILLLGSTTKASVDYEDKKDFVIMMSRMVRFVNTKHPNKAPLLVSLVGATIDSIAKDNSTSAYEDEDEWAGEEWVEEEEVVFADPVTTPDPKKTTNGTAYNLVMSDKTTLSLKVKPAGNVTHFSFIWPGADEPNPKRELCLNYHDAVWFGAYQRYTPEWPLNSSTTMPRTPFNYLLDFQNNPQKEEFYLILEHLFINSDGYAILLDEKAPLFIRRDAAGSEPAMCISVNNSYPYLENNPDPMYRDLQIQIFAAPNIKEVLDYVMANVIPKPTAAPADIDFTTPKWNVYSIYGQFIHRDNLYVYANSIEKQGYWNSELVLNNQWEEIKGQFKFHPGLYGSAQEVTARLHSEKFRLQVSVNPIIWENDASQQAHRQLFIKNKAGTALTFFIDFGNEEAAGFYEAELRKLHFSNGVDSFFVTSDALRDFHLSDYDMQLTPSLLTKKYVETVAKASPNSTTTLAFKNQALPLMVQLTNLPTTPFETLLKTLIPNALSVSLAGYSFIIPYHIGGFWPGAKPTEEIYIRMVQACALMPSMSFSWGPWYYSQNAMDITKKMVDLHSQYAPKIIELAKKRVSDGTPIIRPMWYAAPEDKDSFKVADQFMLGDDIIVAPVVEINQRQRSVYLPPGNWVDAHGRVHKGPSVTRVAANLEDLPIFTRKV